VLLAPSRCRTLNLSFLLWLASVSLLTTNVCTLRGIRDEIARALLELLPKDADEDEVA